MLPRPPQYLLLDAWRGVAALWVVMVHACLAYAANGHVDILSNPIIRISVWGQLGVVLFFVISGYCISGAAFNCINNRKPINRFLFERIRRIYPPYLIAFAIALAVRALAATLQNSFGFSFSSLSQEIPLNDYKFWLGNITLTQVQIGIVPMLFVAWSLCYEVFFYLIVGLFIALGSCASRLNVELRINLFKCGIHIITITSLLWLIISPSTCPFPLDRWYQFGFGVLLFSIISSKDLQKSASLDGLSISCFLVCLYYTFFCAPQDGDLGHPSAQIQAFTCIFFFILLLLLRPVNEKISRWKLIRPLMWLGTFSYSIYLIHTIAISFPYALRKIGLDGSLFMINYLLQLIAAIGAGWLFFYLWKKNLFPREPRSVLIE